MHAFLAGRDAPSPPCVIRISTRLFNEKIKNGEREFEMSSGRCAAFYYWQPGVENPQWVRDTALVGCRNYSDDKCNRVCSVNNRREGIHYEKRWDQKSVRCIGIPVWRNHTWDLVTFSGVTPADSWSLITRLSHSSGFSRANAHIFLHLLISPGFSQSFGHKE